VMQPTAKSHKVKLLIPEDAHARLKEIADASNIGIGELIWRLIVDAGRRFGYWTEAQQ
jgi:hypothetical protein